MAHQVFICHSSRDKAVAEAACTALETRGIGCWIAPRNVLPGRAWGGEIIDALSSAQIVVLIFSREANDSEQVQREVERTLHYRKILVPLRIEDVEPSGAMEYALGNTHWLDAFPPPVEPHLDELVQTVARLLEGKTPVPPMVKLVAPPATGPAAPSLPPVTPVAKPVLPGPNPTTPASATSGPVPDLAPPRGSGSPTLWMGSIAVVIVLGILGFMALRPHHVLIRDAESGLNQARVKGGSRQDADTTEAEAERFYRDKDFAAAFPLAKSACDGGVAAGCNYEAAMYLTGSGVAKDEAQAFELYRRACDGGKPAGCSNLGAMYQEGKGTVQDDARALVHYGKSCDQGYVIGCSAVGDIYEKGRGVPADAARAAEFYQKGCDGGSMVGCSRLAALYYDGRGVAQDQAQALKLFGKACEGRHQSACDFLKSHPQ